jgi:hypothetical protein
MATRKGKCGEVTLPFYMIFRSCGKTVWGLSGVCKSKAETLAKKKLAESTTETGGSENARHGVL